jgi:hypothetical protein
VIGIEPVRGADGKGGNTTRRLLIAWAAAASFFAAVSTTGAVAAEPPGGGGTGGGNPIEDITLNLGGGVVIHQCVVVTPSGQAHEVSFRACEATAAP